MKGISCLEEKEQGRTREKEQGRKNKGERTRENPHHLLQKRSSLMRRMGKEIWLLVLFFLALINASPIPLRTDLGREKMEIYTKNPMAQQYFNQGL